jgi:hypothetical protein
VTAEDQPDRFAAFAQQGSEDLLQLVRTDGADAQEAFLPCFDSLEEWVVSVFAPTYARRATPTFRWCSEWWRHPEAISRLEALWRSWEALRLDPLLGMGSWYRDHLDHQLPILTAAAGPFAECDPTRHFPPETDRLAHTSAPADWWPPARG